MREMKGERGMGGCEGAGRGGGGGGGTGVRGEVLCYDRG